MALQTGPGDVANKNGQPDRRFRTQFRKTIVCAFFGRGWCSKGDGCEFAHGIHELESVPDLTKTSLCKKWLRFQCRLSSSECSFAHGAQELRVTESYVQKPKNPKNPKNKGKRSEAIERQQQQQTEEEVQQVPSTDSQQKERNTAPESGSSPSSPQTAAEVVKSPSMQAEVPVEHSPSEYHGGTGTYVTLACPMVMMPVMAEVVQGQQGLEIVQLLSSPHSTTASGSPLVSLSSLGFGGSSAGSPVATPVVMPAPVTSPSAPSAAASMPFEVGGAGPELAGDAITQHLIVLAAGQEEPSTPQAIEEALRRAMPDHYED